MRVWIFFLLVITGFVHNPSSIVADELVIDLQAQDASKDWLFLDKTARIKDGELVFDGRQKIPGRFLSRWVFPATARTSCGPTTT